LSYLRKSGKPVRVDEENILEGVENSLQRLGIDYIDLLQIHWPDRYVPMFGENKYDPSQWRESVPIVEQLQALKKVIDQGKVWTMLHVAIL
jgi:aryl-alcohol dehydrogenase-like predicted oxidoreductase